MNCVQEVFPGILYILGCISFCIKLKCRKSSNNFLQGPRRTLASRSNISGVIMEPSSKTLVLMIILMNLVLLTNCLLLILLSRMVLSKERIGLWLKWQELCLKNIRLLVASGLKQSTLHAISSTGYIFTNSSRKPHMNSSLIRNPM